MYSIRIIRPETAGIIGGEYAVIVIKHEFPNSTGRVISSISGIASAERAKQVALDYQACYGVQA